ncbi:MAG: hypothetical protein OXF67_05505 [Cyanobacteria bacterium MAG CAR4_bin_6]|nr:hypothetical protein [Cyanobacteria bacterium MAG CAR4_bin_6]
MDGLLLGAGASHGRQPDIAAVMLPARGGARPMAPHPGCGLHHQSTVPVGWPPGRWNRKQPITMTTPSIERFDLGLRFGHCLSLRMMASGVLIGQRLLGIAEVRYGDSLARSAKGFDQGVG